LGAHTDCRLGISRCGKPAVGKWRGHWYCSEHLDEEMKEWGPRTEMPESDTFL